MSTETVEFPIHQKVLSFVSAPRKMLIDGRWLKAVSWKPSQTYRPAMGEVLAQVAEANCVDVSPLHGKPRERAADRVQASTRADRLRSVGRQDPPPYPLYYPAGRCRTAVVDLLDVMLKPARLLWVAEPG